MTSDRPEGYRAAQLQPVDDDVDSFDIPTAAEFVQPLPGRRHTPAVEPRPRPAATPPAQPAPPPIPPPTDPAAPQPARRRSVGRLAAIVAVSLMLAAAIGGGALFLLGDRNPTSQAPPPPAESTSADVAAAAEPSCPVRADDAGVTVGNGPGDQNSGPGVILAFNHAYYTLRSAEGAHAMAAANAVGSPAALQRGIDEIAVGSTYCMRIAETAPNQYWVTNVVSPPTSGQPGIGGETPQPEVYKQVIQTTDIGGKTWIASIRKG